MPKQEKTTKAVQLFKEQKSLQKLAETVAQVTTHEEHVHAVDVLDKLAIGRDKALNWVEPQRESAKKTYDIILEKKRELINPYDACIATIRQGVAAFETQERLRVEREQRQAEEKAEAEAEREKQALMTRMEKLRAKRDKLKSDKAIDRVNDEIDELKEQLDDVDSTDHIDHVRSATKTKGSAADIVVEVTDPVKFLAWLIKNKKIEIDTAVSIKAGAIKAYSKATGDRKIPGCAIKDTTKVEAKRRK
jgi:hypothetical protein